jgi:hypothetical protein
LEENVSGHTKSQKDISHEVKDDEWKGRKEGLGGWRS